MDLTFDEWNKIKSLNCKVTVSDSVFELQRAATSLYKENWYKYNNAYYSLIFNQVACVWCMYKDNSVVYAFKHYDVKQANSTIEYFNTQKELVCRYIKLLRMK